MITNTNSNILDSEQFTLSKITHELRNPLTVIYSTLQLIEQAHPEVKTYKQWDNLFYDVEFMIDFLGQLSLYNHCEKRECEIISVTPFLKQLVLSFASSVSDTGIEFTSCIDSGLPDIEGDKTQLKEVLFNLFKNAVDAVLSKDSTTRPNTIKLNASANKDRIIITLTDSGCGISPENQKNVFKPFVTYKKDGTGIGLPISLKIIQTHGGTLDFTSVSGEGTSFRVTLPAKKNCGEKSGKQPTDMCPDINS